MKLLRVGEHGKEIPAIIDSQNNFRNLSKIIKDFTPENLNFEILDKIKQLNLNSLPLINNNQRIGSCVIKPANFIAIGLNYKAHAEETNSDAPTEPIVFNKSPNCITGLATGALVIVHHLADNRNNACDVGITLYVDHSRLFPLHLNSQLKIKNIQSIRQYDSDLQNDYEYIVSNLAHTEK